MRMTLIPEQPDTSNWSDLGKVIVYITAPFLLLWRFITMYYKEREENRINSIKIIVKEVCMNLIDPIEKQIHELSDRTDKSFTKVHGRIDDIFKELNK